MITVVFSALILCFSLSLQLPVLLRCALCDIEIQSPTGGSLSSSSNTSFVTFFCNCVYHRSCLYGITSESQAVVECPKCASTGTHTSISQSGTGGGALHPHNTKVFSSSPPVVSIYSSSNSVYGITTGRLTPPNMPGERVVPTRSGSQSISGSTGNMVTKDVSQIPLKSTASPSPSHQRAGSVSSSAVPNQPPNRGSVSSSNAGGRVSPNVIAQAASTPPSATTPAWSSGNAMRGSVSGGAGAGSVALPKGQTLPAGLPPQPPQQLQQQQQIKPSGAPFQRQNNPNNRSSLSK